MSFAKLYPCYIAKAEKKNRTATEVDTVICWLTGHSQAELHSEQVQQQDIEHFLKRLHASIHYESSSKA